MGKVWNYMKQHNLTELSIATILLSIIYLVAWFCNGFAGYHFSCSDLITFYTVIVLKNLGEHGINSVWNSNRGYIVTQQPQQIQMSNDSITKANNSMNYTINLVNMSLQQLWNIAYQAGFEDAMEIVKTDQGTKQ